MASIRHSELIRSIIYPCYCGYDLNQGWGEYYSGTRLAQNNKHEYTKNIVLEYYSSTDFPVLVLVCWVLAPALTSTLSQPPPKPSFTHTAVTGFTVCINSSRPSDPYLRR